jgi:hypothetical protein
MPKYLRKMIWLKLSIGSSELFLIDWPVDEPAWSVINPPSPALFRWHDGELKRPGYCET